MSDQPIAAKNIPNDRLILVGVISSAHSIQGHIVVKSFTNPIENIGKLKIFDENHIALNLEIIRKQPNGNLICRLENCCTRSEAERLAKKSLYCYRRDLPEIYEADEFYIEDLKGLKLLDPQGNHIGIITNVANYGGGDVVEVQLKGQRLQMLPFTKEIFLEVKSDYAVLVLPVDHQPNKGSF